MSRIIAAIRKPAPRDGYLHLSLGDVLVMSLVCSLLAIIIWKI